MYFEQILEATSRKTGAIRLIISSLKNYPILMEKTCGTLGESKNELIRDVLLWTPTQRRANIGRPTRTYLRPVWTLDIISFSLSLSLYIYIYIYIYTDYSNILIHRSSSDKTEFSNNLKMSIFN